VPGQVRDQPRGDGVELTHVPEPGAAQQRPNVDGAYARPNNRPMPPCRSRCMSSMLSAPATIPATSEATFNPGCAPRSVGTVNHSSVNARSPTRSASATTGTRPQPTDDSAHRSTLTTAKPMAESHSLDALCRGPILTSSKPDHPATQGHPASTTRSNHQDHR
jgi:hypothetical protein